VPAAAVIPALVACADVVAVKTLTVDLRSSELMWGSVILRFVWGEVVGQVWRKEGFWSI